MAERSGFFNSSNGDRKYKADFFAEYFASFIGNGVFSNPSNNLQVISNNNMTITVKQGKAWINGYYYSNDSDLILNIDVADGVLNRIDRIALQFSTINREIRAVVKKGTFSSSPVAPALQRDADAYELVLADIAINKGVVSISQANIADKRLDKNLCGVVHGVVEQVDVTTLFNQYTEGFKLKEQGFEQQFNEWFNTVKNTLGEDIAGNLLNLINQNSNKIEILTQEQQDLKITVSNHTSDLAQKVNIKSGCSGDTKTFLNTGIYRGTFSDYPEGLYDGQGILSVFEYTGKSWLRQEFYSAHNGRLYERYCSNGSWSNWKIILNKTDYDQLFQYANDGKTGIANAVTAKGVTASPTDTFTTLASKIGQIETGKKASGELTFPTIATEQQVTVSNLAFKPNIILVWLNTEGGGSTPIFATYSDLTIYTNPAKYVAYRYGSSSESSLNSGFIVNVLDNSFTFIYKNAYTTNVKIQWLAIKI